MKHLICLLTLPISVYAFSSGQKPIEPLNRLVGNPAFSKNKTPNETEPKIDDSLSQNEWEKAILEEDCNDAKVWSVENDPNVRVVAFKNSDELPVKGTFDRSKIQLSWNPKSRLLIGKGLIDLSSYNTGNGVRDRRVIREIFKVEDSETSSVARFTFELENAEIGPKPLLTDLALKVSFHGKSYDVISPSKLWNEKGTIRLESQKESRLSFSAARYLMAGILRLMERCNHQSIGSFADIGFDVALKSACKSK